MKILILLGLCSIYTVSSFVVTVPIEYMDLESDHKNSIPDVKTMDQYWYNSPNDDVEVFSPVEVQHKDMPKSDFNDSNDVNDQQATDQEIPFIFTVRTDNGMDFDGWNVSPDTKVIPEVQITPMIPNFEPSESDFVSKTWFGTPILNTPHRFYGTNPQSNDSPKIFQDDDVSQEKVIVNGIPTDLSQEMDETFEEIYNNARVYRWLIRYCITHPRCDANALMELIMSIPQDVNKEFQNYGSFR